jgi:hypothetical protein
MCRKRKKIYIYMYIGREGERMTIPVLAGNCFLKLFAGHLKVRRRKNYRSIFSFLRSI